MTPPQSSELELSVFGPGIGECLVLHLGNDKWMVVDSCLNAAGDRPIALDYLDRLNVDVANNVVAVVATHWHDDHIRGLNDVVEAAASATFVCSSALNAKEFLTFVGLSQSVKLVGHDKGVSEFASILDTINLRQNAKFRIGPSWAISDRPIHRQSTPCELEVVAISPSDQTISDFKLQMAEQIQLVGKMIQRPPCVSPNDSSVAVIVKTTDFSLILGADLEKGNDGSRGWQAAIRCQSCANTVSGAFKVPHHGSPDAHLQEVWENNLASSCRALLTPYARGRTARPTMDDVNRIKLSTEFVYLSTVHSRLKPPRRPGADGMMKRTARNRFAYQNNPGHIRLRIPLGVPEVAPTIDLFEGAQRM